MVHCSEVLNHHVPKGHPERPERVSGVMSTLNSSIRGRHQGLVFLEVKEKAGWDVMTMAHCSEYLERIKKASEAAGKTPRRLSSKDEDTFISSKSFEAATYAAGACCHAGDLLMQARF